MSGLLLLLLALLGTPPEPPGRLCIAPADADFENAATCSESPLRRIQVSPSTERRRFVWTSPARQDLVLGIVLPGDSEIVLARDRAGALQLQLEGAKNREWPVPATVTLREPNLGSWRFTLSAEQVVQPLTLRLPHGTYDVDVVAAGHRLFSKKAMTIGRIDVRPVALHGVLAAQPRLSATVFAKGKRVPFARLQAGSRICESSADGRLICDLIDAVPETVRVEHPQFGGRTIAIDRRMTDIDLGNVELRRGGTVFVERPPHVELPERTFAALLVAARDGRQIAAKRVDGETAVTFDQVDPGEYIVLLRGPQSAQRKTFEVHVEEGTESRLTLAIEPYQLTAKVTFDREPFAGAHVQLKERYWDARLETDAGGRFESELWTTADFAVLVSGGAVREPFGTMRRADVADSNWTIEVPSRSLGGSVRDAATGKPLANVRVVVESDDGNVRQTRLLQTDDGGKFSLASVATGSHEIRVQAEGYHSPEAERVRLADGDRERKVDFALTAATFVDLTVIDAMGRPVADATVIGERGRVRRTAADGKVRVPAGEHLYVLPRDGSLSSGVFGEDAAWRVDPPAGTIRIVVTSAGDTPVSGVGAALRLNGIAVPAAVLRQLAMLHGGGTTTGPTGEIVFSRLPAGIYEVCLGPCSAWTRIPLTSGEARVAVMLR